ncbi:hypothetical protein PHLCEN_2v752 [Hermanssonia centrifuga]|uniref:DUF6533 domain-containing protein n=1 Tax=Hermanssonia centrifuga TaxID=98765 RepID=A0A2R6S531_9APHY|nr:hypothetical protein PHLCEN_2v752 [Hermanssonia centrifuga]
MNKLSGCGPKTTEQRSARVVQNKAHISEGQDLGKQALFAYEYIITLEQERTMIWRRKWSLATWLFMINRYLLVGYIIWTATPSTSSFLFTRSTNIFSEDPRFGTFCGAFDNDPVNVTFE